MEKPKKKAVLYEDERYYRIIGLEERAEIGFIHKDYPSYPMKRYFTKVRDFMGYEIINIASLMDEIEERLKELE